MGNNIFVVALRASMLRLREIKGFANYDDDKIYMVCNSSIGFDINILFDTLLSALIFKKEFY